MERVSNGTAIKTEYCAVERLPYAVAGDATMRLVPAADPSSQSEYSARGGQHRACLRPVRQ